ncbi:nicotinate-nucleotide--dimethylbenzimidazole phosphoribosyltransferase [Pedobacter sp. MC2016-24]|uniref:nicotinate-nucleotide--dimethylbenzimidazole phosphoribosyltransferase n=1 Tax=Pedobacter sp. MC2016-24 TaxID=2780090 RepID=UPI00187F233E|nr:nicotinate-nucleotide--dimethylbenzimidazole phosphoribosyltransferase [Pedobacter sp. MC2016-24]MBE9600957.1 nicotinate-nucleotide--dimethylbenzimidazole phosphoribosyltransferase [Pedobacter sp. MC2016-24]
MMLKEEIQKKIDFKTKPQGALGILEELALQICLVQDTLSPVLNKPEILVFAADHGAASAGISAYPAAVTAQMVLNFLSGGAAINVFCKQHGISLRVVDAGVNYDFPESDRLIDAKVAKGTQNYLVAEAISAAELSQCFNRAEHIVDAVYQGGCNIIGFGEMGIGNTSSASLLMSYLCELPLEECVGRGTGLNDEQLAHKMTLLKSAQEHHGEPSGLMQALQFYGGFEIAQICAAMLKAYENNMLIMVDGFIASVAFLCAHRLNPKVIDNAIFCHESNEKGHQLLLKHLDVKPILGLGMRLGEGTGCALAYPLIHSAVLFMNEMASFDSAGVSNKTA